MSLTAILLLVILALALIGLIYILFWGIPPWINVAVQRLTLRQLLQDPESLTSIGVLDNTLLDFHSGQLTDVSPDQVTVGMPVEMVTRKVREFGEDGVLLYGYKFRPLFETQKALA